jgi:hypothetical protein
MTAQQEPRSDIEWQRLPEIRAKFLDYVGDPTDANALRIIGACRERFAAASVQAAPSDLHAAIMNLPSLGNPDYMPAEAIAYKLGHRDARHAAAELALSAQAAPAVDGPDQMRFLLSPLANEGKELRGLHAAPAAVPVQPADSRSKRDAEMLDFIAAEYLDLVAFAMPTGAGDADVGWKLIKHHEGKKGAVEVGIAYRDDPREAISAAMQALGALASPPAQPAMPDVKRYELHVDMEGRASMKETPLGAYVHLVDIARFRGAAPQAAAPVGQEPVNAQLLAALKRIEKRCPTDAADYTIASVGDTARNAIAAAEQAQPADALDAVTVDKTLVHEVLEALAFKPMSLYSEDHNAGLRNRLHALLGDSNG